MKKTYTAKKMPENTTPIQFSSDFDASKLPAAFAELNDAEVAEFPWLAQYPDRFETHFRMGYNSENLFVLMYAVESPVQSKENEFGGCQCRDSCMEFFVKPFPERDDRYLNIEINPLAVPHVGLGESRRDRHVYKNAIPGMTINSVIGDNGVWAICYNVPASFVKEIYGDFPKTGDMLSANFYKCSEDIHPHFGVWSSVEAPRPDFHRPEYFGDIVLE